MGTQRIGTLPDTAPWRRVVSLLADEADVAVVAEATTRAALKGLRQAGRDQGMGCCLFLLTQLVLAARQDDFAAGLRDAGLTVSDAPDVYDLVGGFSAAVDARLH